LLQVALSHSLRKTRVNRGERANWILEDGTESLFTAHQPRTRFNEKSLNLEATFRF